VILASSANNLNLKASRIPTTVLLAAQYYTLIYKHNVVTCRQLLETGLLPFHVVDSADLDKTVFTDGSRPLVNSLEVDQAAMPEMQLYFRQRVLKEFYREFYSSHNSLNQLAPQDLRKNPGFWIDPRTGESMRLGKGLAEIEALTPEEIRTELGKMPITTGKTEPVFPWFRLYDSNSEIQTCCWLFETYQEVNAGHPGCVARSHCSSQAE
jgi:hypothetical protein